MSRILFILICTVFVVPNVFAATAKIRETPSKFLTSEDTEFGGCMVGITTVVRSKGLDCKGKWLTFDCAAVSGGKKSSAARLYESALIASMQSQRVEYLATDDRKVNGYCVITRVRTL